MLRNELLWRNELYSKSSLKSQSLKQKVTNPQTQRRSFSWFVLFALLIWACVHLVPPPHPPVPAVPLNVPMPSLCGGTTHSFVAMAVSNIPLLQLPPQQTFWTPHPSQIRVLFIFLLRWVLSKPYKNDGKNSTDFSSSHPLCVCMFIQKFRDQYASHCLLRSVTTEQQSWPPSRICDFPGAYMYD